MTREYIPDMANINAPIQALAKKGIEIRSSWKEKIHGRVLAKIKEILTSAPVLILPDLSKPLRIHADECSVGKGIEAVLLQKVKELWIKTCSLLEQRTKPHRKKLLRNRARVHSTT